MVKKKPKEICYVWGKEKKAYFTGPRSFAEAMSMNWDPHKREWSKR